MTRKNKYIDHLGNTFPSATDMAHFWNISETTLKRRRNMGWSWYKTLTTPLPKTKNQAVFSSNYRYTIEDEKANLKKILDLFLKECDKVYVIEYFEHFGFFIPDITEYFPGMEALLYRLFFISSNGELPFFQRAEYPRTITDTGYHARLFVNADVADQVSLYELKIIFKAILLQGIRAKGLLVHGKYEMKARGYEHSYVKETTNKTSSIYSW